jgi:hypothetical protein
LLGFVSLSFVRLALSLTRNVDRRSKQIRKATGFRQAKAEAALSQIAFVGGASLAFQHPLERIGNPQISPTRLDINQRGVPFNIQVDKSSDKDLDDEVIAMIREWRFEAALNGGVGVPSRG